MPRIEELYDDGDDFEDVLYSAEEAAANSWQVDFTSTVRAKWEEWGMRTFITDQQHENLRKIAGCGD